MLQGCTNHRSGLTRIEAKVEGILHRKNQDWRLMCESTPFSWNGVNYTSPTHCEERVSEPRVYLSILVPDEVNRSYHRAWEVARRLQCGMCPLRGVSRNLFCKYVAHIGWIFLVLPFERKLLVRNVLTFGVQASRVHPTEIELFD
jgi:hypothetical protein